MIDVKYLLVFHFEEIIKARTLKEKFSVLDLELISSQECKINVYVQFIENNNMKTKKKDEVCTQSF